MTELSHRISARLPLIFGLTTLLMVVGFMLGWGAFTALEGAVIASGRIEVAQNHQVVAHLDGGMVTQLLVTESQAVEAGDVLMQLDGRQLKSDLAVTEAQLFELLAHRARLEAERDGSEMPVFSSVLVGVAETRPEVARLMSEQRALFDTRSAAWQKQDEQLRRRLEQIAAQVQGIVAQETALHSQMKLTNRDLTDQRSLFAKGLTQSARVLSLEREVAGIQGDLGETVAARAQAEGRAIEVDLEILRLSDLRREEAATTLRDLAPREAELTERQRSLNERLARLTIRAPVSGLAMGLQVTGPGAVIRPAEPLLYIVPQDRPLIVVAQVSPLDIDAISDGQQVRLILPSLSGRQAPELTGQVANISADAFAMDDGRSSFYRAEIHLDDSALVETSDQRLVPGMPVEAFIHTGAHTPLAYLLQPFTDYFRIAMRES